MSLAAPRRSTWFQRVIGNGLTAPASQSRIFPQLEVTPAHDRLESEADRVADAVLRQPAPEPVGRGQCIPSGAGVAETIQRQVAGVGKAASCAQPSTQAPATNAQFRGPAPVARADSTFASGQGEGVLLDVPTRAFFEPRFGHSFADVRVHCDAEAHDAASALGARAFAMGNHIVFARGQWAPRSTSGRRLLAHELAHVVQQARGGVRVSRKGYEGGGDSVSAAPWFDGVKATIDHVDPPVNTTRSVAWTGIDNGGEGGMKWLQGGWGKNQGEAAKIYWEYTDKTGAWAKGFSSAPAASETFEIVHEGTNAVWKHGGASYKSVSWDKFDTIEFRRAVYTTEMHTPPGDHTPGRVSDKNDFVDCAARRAAGSYAAASLSTTFDSATHGNVERQGGSNLRTWDSRDA